MACGCIILTVSIIATMRFTRRVAKPLRDLTEAAKQLDEGNYEFSLDYDKDDEIGILTRTFKQLAANTKEKIMRPPLTSCWVCLRRFTARTSPIFLNLTWTPRS